MTWKAILWPWGEIKRLESLVEQQSGIIEQYASELRRVEFQRNELLQRPCADERNSALQTMIKGLHGVNRILSEKVVKLREDLITALTPIKPKRKRKKKSTT